MSLSSGCNLNFKLNSESPGCLIIQVQVTTITVTSSTTEPPRPGRAGHARASHGGITPVARRAPRRRPSSTQLESSESGSDSHTHTASASGKKAT